MNVDTVFATWMYELQQTRDLYIKSSVLFFGLFFSGEEFM